MPKLPPQSSELPPEPGGKPLTELSAGECRWPTGKLQRVENFCAAPVARPGLQYCETHMRAAYRPTPAMRSSSLRNLVRVSRIADARADLW